MKIDQNKARTVVIVDDDFKTVGIATDGNIRRFLINNPDVTSKISECLNTEFTSASGKDSREKILKFLDNTIQLVPILEDDKTLVDVVTKDDFPLSKEKNLVARCKSPVRISFGGGGTDLTHYFVKHGGAVMNATVKIYSHSSLRKRFDGKIRINSADLGMNLEANSLKELKDEGEFKLIVAAIKLINPTFGFDLTVYSDFPMKSGLGGSAVVISSIIGCFN
ncbi:MAG: hypothetical protein KC478_08490 [Bacteriovoracaceae bacterium]|nr:hypothetical protein [Bacteriovoracaceae bacterium]